MAKKDKKGKSKKLKQTSIPDPFSAPPLDIQNDDIEANLIAVDIVVPPPTPSSQFGLEIDFQPLPPKLPDVSDLKIPLVRKSGIKLCIDILAEYFQCYDYKFNLFQFWFLDIVTDCLWKVQDEFRFPDSLQKTVLEWILFVFDKMRDPQEDVTRKKLFTIFKESVLVGAEYIDEGGRELPAPEKLFSLLSQEPSERSTSVTSSVSLHSSEQDAESVVFFNTKQKSEFYSLKQEVCECNQYNMSSVDTVTESDITKSDKKILEEENVKANASNSSFESINEEDYLVQEIKEQYDVISAPSSLTLSEHSSCASNIFVSTVHPEESSIELMSNTSEIGIDETVTNKADMEFDKCSFNKKIKILTKYLTNLNLHEQKTAAMNDSEKGWIPSEEELEEASQDDMCSESEWTDVIDEHDTNVEDSAFVHFGVLWAIIDFVFNYFYESFQFTLIKLAFREYPSVVCQRVNQEWRVPKVPKGEFIPPPEKKEKKEKAKKKGKKEKKKKEKKKGKDKKSKKSKGSKKDKKSKKDKSRKKDKGSKKGKKGKKEKPVKLTKEQKEELERLRLEQERIEEERRKREENRLLMFPLNDAADDDLFNEIFESWVKVDLTAVDKGKKGKKKGKDKKDKKGKKKKK